MKRVRMVVSYDGTAYRGWQLQPNGITIEEVLNRELTALLKEPISVIGASRTDSGVHARGNIVVFDTEIKKPILNKYLQHKISFRTGFACRTVTTQSVAIQIMLPYVTMILTACQLIFDFLLSVFHNQFIKYDSRNPATILFY